MCLIFDFSHKFSFYNSVWIRIRIFFSDSDPVKTLGFFRIRIPNTAYDKYYRKLYGVYG
jgi:hypothetical protein